MSRSLLRDTPVLPIRFSMLLSVIFGAIGIGASPAMTWAEDAKEPAAEKEETDPEYAVPDGTPDEIMEFIEKLKNRKPKFANRKEQVDHAIRMYRAFIEAGDKILKQEAEPKVAVDAAKLKLNALTVLAANEIDDSGKESLAAVKALRDDKREDVAKVAEEFSTTIRVINVLLLSDDERKELTNEILASITETRFSRDAIGAAQRLADTLSRKNHNDEALEVYERLLALVKESDDPKIQSSGKRFEGIVRRMRLPGHFMEIEGQLLKGGDFDWASYRGQVVLVDFWATWCGPCIAELPNVKRAYEKYHEKGFDVVGISLDRSREPLDKFIEKNEIPWTQLYDEDVQKGNGWNHPMAEFFGISAIPAAILVDKDGKVISMNARGEELTEQLEKLFGKAE